MPKPPVPHLGSCQMGWGWGRSRSNHPALQVAVICPPSTARAVFLAQETAFPGGRS